MAAINFLLIIVAILVIFTFVCLYIGVMLAKKGKNETDKAKEILGLFVSFISIVLGALSIITSTVIYQQQTQSSANIVQDAAEENVQSESSLSIKRGWNNLNGKTTYINEFGNAVKGWHPIEDNWYYFGDDCVMLHSTWFEYESDWYYLHGDGTMAYSTTIGEYIIGPDGKWVNKQIPEPEPSSEAVIESSTETEESTKAVASETQQTTPPKQTEKPTESVPPTQPSTQAAATVENHRELYLQYFNEANNAGTNRQEARKLYEKALEYAVTSDEYADVLKNIGWLYVQDKDYLNAVIYLEESLKYRIEYYVLYDIALFSEQIPDYEKAAKYWKLEDDYWKSHRNEILDEILR